MKRRFIFLLLLCWVAVFSGPVEAGVSVSSEHGAPIGRHVEFLHELHGRMTLDQAVSDWQAGRFHKGASSTLEFGIGAKPVWIHLGVENPEKKSVIRRLTIATPWLDWVDVYVRQAGRTVATYHLGDRLPFAARPVDSRYLAIEHDFAPGKTNVFVRIQTADPMVVPLYLESRATVKAEQHFEDYSYGFLYGFLLALLAYNAVLFVGLRESKYLLYSFYLGMFMMMNLSYTGHAFDWFWPNSTQWAQWSQPTLMMLYASSGLIFALSFLSMRRHFPRLVRLVIAYIVLSAILLAAFIAIDDQRNALLLAFSYVTLFTLIMPVLGVVAVRAGVHAARYFLLAALAAMIGAGITALAVWGFIPFNVWTFRAIDIGIMLDATLLALALAYQFRIGQEERIRAEQLARIDPLTGLNNRRAFYDVSGPICNITQRHQRDLSVILLDLDHFKQVNDLHGHLCGDEVLRKTAAVLVASIRDHDVIARWGGEEFILLLPETDLDEAVALAERLRVGVESNSIACNGRTVQITSSFGVAHKDLENPSLAEVIQAADRQLYRAKESGRNRVCFAPVSESGDMTRK